MSARVSPPPRLAQSGKAVAGTPASAGGHARRHLIVLIVMVAVSLAFYALTLDNPLWHDEDFNLLDITIQAQQLDTQPWTLDPEGRHHPLPLLLFGALYRWLGLEPAGYYVLNLLLHGINAFLVYWLVTVLLPDRRIALLSGLLFAMGVGSYGKAVMFVAGVENLFITAIYLLVLNLYIRNDLFDRGRVLSLRYAAVVVLFLIASYSQPTAFSLVGCLLAYKVFFRGERGRERRVFEPHLLVLLAAGVGFWGVRQLSGSAELVHAPAGTNPWNFGISFVKNMANYVVHMFFPIHVSRLVSTAHPVVRAIYDAAPFIRAVIGLAVVSYTVFGFVFGNRTLRFFLVWTFISLVPYSVLTFPADWLNIRYLYSVAVGFNFILASGTILSMDLLHRRRWRRLVPLAFPALFVLLSAYVTMRLDTKYEVDGNAAAARSNRARLEAMHGAPGAD
jgi:hypothetical protein